MSWDEPTQAEYEDAVIEDTVHCRRCSRPYVLPDGFLFGNDSICEECAQEEINATLARLSDAQAELAQVKAERDAARKALLLGGEGDSERRRAMAAKLREWVQHYLDCGPYAKWPSCDMLREAADMLERFADHERSAGEIEPLREASGS